LGVHQACFLYVAGTPPESTDYAPLEQRLQLLRQKYENDPEKLQYLEVEQNEIRLYREYSSFYGYIFYVLQVDEKVNNE
jgi:hypothetical protein